MCMYKGREGVSSIHWKTIIRTKGSPLQTRIGKYTFEFEFVEYDNMNAMYETK